MGRREPIIQNRAVNFDIRPRIATKKPRAIEYTIVPSKPKRFKLPKISYRVLTAGGLSLVIILELIGAAFLPQLINPDRFYSLSQDAQKVVGEVDDKLASKLSYDAENERYQYNADAAPIDQSNSADPEAVAAQLAAQQTTGDNSEKIGGGADNYTVDLNIDPEKGVTVRDATDKTGSLAVSLIPQFDMRPAKQMDDRIIYPLKGMNGHVVYSVKSNGLKEDIVLNESPGDELSLNYQLNLPKALEARLLDDGQVGIYSADTSLFGNISFGSDEDRARVENARNNGEKNHLVFAIPAPEIIQSGEGNSEVKSEFSLENNILTINTAGLDKASYPLSIDPSVVVTSATDFDKGNLEGGININSSGQLERAGLTGGSTGAWTDDTDSALPATRNGGKALAYNGYLYVMGGNDNSNQVVYTSISSSDGSLGSWTTTNAYSSVRSHPAVAVYNGYLYVMGGVTPAGSVMHNTVEYARINSNGSVGTWSSAGTGGTFTTARFGHRGVAYDGYLYIMGGCITFNSITATCTAETTNVQYASIKADGTLGSWADTASFTTDRSHFAAQVYNGNLYIMGGCSAGGVAGACNTRQSDVQYAPINSDGTVGTWIATTSFSDGNYNLSSSVYDGYLYLVGGAPASGGANGNIVRYAPINADGTIGAWTAGSTMTSARFGLGSVAYNGYIYATAGQVGGTALSSVEYAQINPAGVTGNYTSGTPTSSPAVFNAGVVAYNGYLYIIGGCSTSGAAAANSCSGAAISNQVLRTTVSSDGTLGASFTSSTALTTGVYGAVALAYNNRLYLVGGATGAGPTANIQYSSVISSGNPGSWSTASGELISTRYLHGAAVDSSNGYIYVAGGCSLVNSCNPNNANNLNDVVSVPINSDGTITNNNGTSQGTFDTNGRQKLAMTAYGGYLYISGGKYGSSTPDNNVIYAQIGSGGTISGGWQSGGTFATNGRHMHNMVAYNGYLYITGGCDSNTTTNCTSVQSSTLFAPLDLSTGDPGTWSTTTSLNTARLAAGASVYQGNLIVASGCNNNATTCSSGNILNSVEVAPINNGGTGTASTWSTAGNNFGGNRARHASLAYNGYLYVVGGHNGTAGQNDVLYAPLSPDGSVGTWGTAGTFTTARFDLAAVAHNGFMYVLGGSGPLNDVQYSAINSNGTLAGFSAATSFNTPTRYGHTAAAYNGYMYVMGGNSGSATINNVQYAQICDGVSTTGGCSGQPAGYVGTWTNSGNSFTTTRFYHSSFTVNGYLYVVAGYNIPSGPLADVQYAPLDPGNGSVGTWNNTSSIPTARYTHVVAPSNGYVYMTGGCNVASCTSYLIDTQMASINSNGTLSQWQSTNSYSNDRGWHGSAIYNGYIYITGGCTAGACTTYLGDTQYAGLKSIARQGTYSHPIDLGDDAMMTYLLYRGTESMPSSFRFGYRNAPSSTAIYGSLSSALTVDPNELYNLTASETRYRLLRFTLDDSSNSVFPDSLGTASTIEDFELWFHPATTGNGSMRLRGGKTFNTVCAQNSTHDQCSLDAQPQ